MSATPLFPWGIIGISKSNNLPIKKDNPVITCERLDFPEIMKLEHQDITIHNMLTIAESLPTKKLTFLWITIGAILLENEELAKTIEDNYRPSILKKLKNLLSHLLTNTSALKAKPVVRKTPDIKQSYQQVLTAIKYFVESENYDEDSFRSLMRMFLKDEDSKNVMLEFIAHSSKNKDLLV